MGCLEAFDWSQCFKFLNSMLLTNSDFALSRLLAPWKGKLSQHYGFVAAALGNSSSTCVLDLGPKYSHYISSATFDEIKFQILAFERFQEHPDFQIFA